MTPLHLLTTAAAMTAIFAGTASAQSATMHLRPESKITIAGGSNVHDWSCYSDAFQAVIEVNPAFGITGFGDIAKPIGKVSVTVPVKSIQCGKGKMDENLQKALRANDFPAITYVLTTYTSTGENTGDKFTATTTGELTVAGKTKTIEVPITATRQADGGGGALGEGSVRFLMSDFGVKPPVALLGTLRTKDAVEVRFTIALDKAVIVALEQR